MEMIGRITNRKNYDRILHLIHDYWGMKLYLAQPAENAIYSIYNEKDK